eukprot:1016972-Prorocentrum_lima.AAC.1
MAGMKTVEEQLGSMKLAKCLGVKDLNGNDLTADWNKYVYLNSCVVSLAQHSVLAPTVARRTVD